MSIGTIDEVLTGSTTSPDWYSDTIKLDRSAADFGFRISETLGSTTREPRIVQPALNRDVMIPELYTHVSRPWTGLEQTLPQDFQSEPQQLPWA